MADRDVQPVRIIVGDRLPVERRAGAASPGRSPAAPRSDRARPPPRKAPSSRRPTARPARASTNRNPRQFSSATGNSPSFSVSQSRIFVAVRHADQPPVAGIAPRVIGAGQHLGAAAIAVDQPRAAMAADVGERPHLAVVAANDDHAFAEIFEAAPFAGLRRSRSRGKRPAARRAGTPSSPPRRTRGRGRASRAGSCRRAGRRCD